MCRWSVEPYLVICAHVSGSASLPAGSWMSVSTICQRGIAVGCLSLSFPPISVMTPIISSAFGRFLLPKLSVDGVTPITLCHQGHHTDRWCLKTHFITRTLSRMVSKSLPSLANTPVLSFAPSFQPRLKELSKPEPFLCQHCFTHCQT